MCVFILAIESSCDDTSVAVSCDNKILANLIANQEVHRQYGGVVPELASRAHQQNIVPVVDLAIRNANISKKDLHAVAYTRGPGLLGSLLVGTAFGKAFSYGLKIPAIAVDHLQAHILCHFIQNEQGNKKMPAFPFLCLTVSGGHTQIVLVKDFFDMEVIGKTIDDAAGEAFDKTAKILGLPYPGGPLVDTLAKIGNPHAFKLSLPKIQALDFSFSGLKTSFLYLIRDQLRKDAGFVDKNLNDLCASMQYSIIKVLTDKLIRASKETGINEIAIAGGVSANSLLRSELLKYGKDLGWSTYIPPLEHSTDNAAMIAVTAFYKYKQGDFADINAVPYTRSK